MINICKLFNADDFFPYLKLPINFDTFVIIMHRFITKVTVGLCQAQPNRGRQRRVKKTFVITLLQFAVSTAFAQKPKDTLIYNLPTVNDHLIYEGTAKVQGRNKATLDSLARAWFFDYFRMNNLSADSTMSISSVNDTTSTALNRGMIEYKVRPGMVNITFIAFINIKVSVADNSYSYKIDHIFFRPKNATLNSVGYQNDPEYLIKVYKKKHLGLATAWNVTRGQIREYLSMMNAVVRSCIASLNSRMNQ